MFDRLANTLLKRGIDNLRPKVIARLKHDEWQTIERMNRYIQKKEEGGILLGLNPDQIDASLKVIRGRLSADHDYAILMHRFRNDAKRQAGLSSNYLNFLKAVELLYATSPINGIGGPAPANVYITINEVMKSFEGLKHDLDLKVL